MLPIVDLHGHYIAGDADSEQKFRRLAESSEVHRIVVCAMDLKLTYSKRFPFMSCFATSNEQLAELMAKISSPKLVPFCFVDPRQKDAAKQAEHWLSNGMRGIKMYPPHGWYPDDERAMPVYEVAAKRNVPVLLHMGRVASHPELRSKYGRPICLEEVGLANPDLKLIIGHWANMWRWEAFHISMSFKNFFFDLTTSGSLHLPIIRETIDHRDLGLRRIVFGTDGSGNNLDTARLTYQRLKDKGGLSQAELDAIFHHNGLAVLGES